MLFCEAASSDMRVQKRVDDAQRRMASSFSLQSQRADCRAGMNNRSTQPVRDKNPPLTRLNPTPCPKFGDFAPSEKCVAVPYGSPGWTDKEFYSHTIDPSDKLFAVSYELMDCRASKVGMLLKCSANFTDGSEERRDAFGSVRAEYACCI